MNRQLFELAKWGNVFNNSDNEIEDYLNKYGNKFYLYIKDDKILGFVDYYITENVLNIYHLVCRGNLLDMWKYGRKFMKDNNLDYISFKRKKYNNKRRTYGRR